MIVAFQGRHGAYSEQAALRYFGRGTDTLPFDTLSEMAENIGGKAAYGIIPVENSVEGSVTASYDTVLENALLIVGEIILRIEHCLIANRGVVLEDVRRVYSHPQALGQCRRYLEGLHVEIIPQSNTAGSVEMIKQNGMLDAAAVAGEAAARIYGMQILKRNIESNKRNYTRFLIVSKGAAALKQGSKKTSIAFVTTHVPGALYRALGCFAGRGINLMYIQSRPIAGRPWHYRFYIDVEGHVQSKNVRSAIEELKKVSRSVRVFGTYPKARISS